MGQPKPGLLKKSEVNWALSNFGILIAVYRRRKYAVMSAENLTGQPWGICSEYMQIWKCRVVPVEDE